MCNSNIASSSEKPVESLVGRYFLTNEKRPGKVLNCSKDGIYWVEFYPTMTIDEHEGHNTAGYPNLDHWNKRPDELKNWTFLDEHPGITKLKQLAEKADERFRHSTWWCHFHGKLTAAIERGAKWSAIERIFKPLAADALLRQLKRALCLAGEQGTPRKAMLEAFFAED